MILNFFIIFAHTPASPTSFCRIPHCCLGFEDTPQQSEYREGQRNHVLTEWTRVGTKHSPEEPQLHSFPLKCAECCWSLKPSEKTSICIKVEEVSKGKV